MSTPKYTLRKFLSFLENPEYPSVGPHLRLLGFTGMWHPTSSKITTFKQILFFITVAFFISQYIKCAINLDIDSLKLILKYAPFHVGIVKSCFFQKDHKLWEKLISYTAKTERDQSANKDRMIDEIINKYISRSRRITYFFWALAIFANFSIFSEPYQKNQIVKNGTSTYLYIFDGYTPFKKVPPGYYASMFIQTVLGYMVSTFIVGWDTLVFSIMIFFAGQLKIARMFCRNIIKVGDKRRSHQNVVEFHRYYTKLIEFQKLFNSLISPVMFVYLIISSVNLGVNIIQIIQLKNDLAALISSVVFVAACLIQLLICYWYGNEVTIESLLVSYSIFESDWIGADIKLQKEVALLGVTTTKCMVFDAGPLNKMSLATFVAILRASYSFYTLMNGTN